MHYTRGEGTRLSRLEIDSLSPTERSAIAKLPFPTAITRGIARSVQIAATSSEWFERLTKSKKVETLAVGDDDYRRFIAVSEGKLHGIQYINRPSISMRENKNGHQSQLVILCEHNDCIDNFFRTF